MPRFYPDKCSLFLLVDFRRRAFLIFSGCYSWKIITKNFIKPPKFKNQLIVIQAACKNKSVVSKIQTIKKAAIRAA